MTTGPPYYDGNTLLLFSEDGLHVGQESRFLFCEVNILREQQTVESLAASPTLGVTGV